MYATKFDVHIGDNADWRKNPKCNPSPLLRKDYKDRTSSFLKDGDARPREVPNFGFEVWCNMFGNYVQVVASGVPA